MNFQFLLLIVLVGLSGLFSGSEVALTSLSRAKVRSMEDDGKFASKMILKLKKEPQHMLVTILLSNQVVNILATVTVTIWGLALFGDGRLGMVTFVFTLIIILFGTIGPKTIALRFPDSFARIIAYPLVGLVYVARPVVWVFELIMKGVLKLLRAKDQEAPSTSEKEIEAMIDISMEEGVIEEEEEEFIKRILKFSKTTVGDVMRLAKEVEAIEAETPKKDLHIFLDEHEHISYPVYKDTLDDIRGVIAAHRLHVLLKKSRKTRPLEKYKRRPLVMLPRTTSLTELFKKLKEKRERMAIVLDEHGQTVGLVTLGDILNEIVGGEIEEEDTDREALIRNIGKNVWDASGEATVSEINKALNIKLDYPEHQTLSLMILEELKRFPDEGEKIALEGIKVEILKLSQKTIDRVIIRKTYRTKKRPEKQKTTDSK